MGKNHQSGWNHRNYQRPEHKCTVAIELGRYRPECNVCGVFGPPSEYIDDARAIGDRHEEIGGFEHLGSEPS